jgi:hypothetical protein
MEMEMHHPSAARDAADAIGGPFNDCSMEPQTIDALSAPKHLDAPAFWECQCKLAAVEFK